MNEAMEQSFRAALEAEMRAFWARERDRSTIPLRINTWTARRGDYVLTPGGSNPHLNGSRLIQLVDRINVGGQRFTAAWNSDLPRIATLTARFNGGGNAQEMVEDPHFGLITTNEWSQDLQGQVRFVSVQQEERNSGYRLIRFEATEAIVNLIQAAGGTISIGFGRATVENNKKSVKRGATIVYKLQK